MNWLAQTCIYVVQIFSMLNLFWINLKFSDREVKKKPKNPSYPITSLFFVACFSIPCCKVCNLIQHCLIPQSWRTSFPLYCLSLPRVISFILDCDYRVFLTWGLGIFQITNQLLCWKLGLALLYLKKSRTSCPPQRMTRLQPFAFSCTACSLPTSAGRKNASFPFAVSIESFSSSLSRDGAALGFTQYVLRLVCLQALWILFTVLADSLSHF